MADINTRVMSGFLELLPEEQVEFDRIKSIIESTYHQFGFTSIDTPIIERSEVLLAKGGDETDQQIYYVTNGLFAKEKDKQALRFDLTVPLARYVADHFNDLVFPFKRCHIGKVYRGERPQRGRFREFYQCDIDVIGRNELSIRHDAEIPSIIYQLFKKLDLGKFTIRVNNRKVLNGLFARLGISADVSKVLRVIDKVEKITKDELLQGFRDAGLTEEQTSSIVGFMEISGDVAHVLDKLNGLGINNELFQEGVNELKIVTDLMLQMGVDPDYFVIDLSIARGLAYYTGTVYETVLDDSRIGSVCSGGRYDNLAGHYTNENLPGVGISIGLTRLFWQLRENNMLSCNRRTVADVVVVPSEDGDVALALSAATELRRNSINVDVLLEDMNFKKKFQYITRKDSRFTVIAKTVDGGREVLSLQYKNGDSIVKEELKLNALVERVVKELASVTV
jgi:histidyl-tRNA synthetase